MERWILEQSGGFCHRPTESSGGLSRELAGSGRLPAWLRLVWSSERLSVYRDRPEPEQLRRLRSQCAVCVILPPDVTPNAHASGSPGGPSGPRRGGMTIGPVAAIRFGGHAGGTTGSPLIPANVV